MPKAPVCWIDVDALAGQGVFPVSKVLRARKYKRMFALPVEDGQFELKIVRSCQDRIPHGFQNALEMQVQP